MWHMHRKSNNMNELLKPYKKQNELKDVRKNRAIRDQQCESQSRRDRETELVLPALFLSSLSHTLNPSLHTETLPETDGGSPWEHSYLQEQSSQKGKRSPEVS